MAATDRPIDLPVRQALETLDAKLRPYWTAYSRPIQVTFPAAANSPIDVRHELRVIPTGMHVVLADAAIIAAPGRQWTTDVAFLQASAANAHATVVFLVLREEATNA